MNIEACKLHLERSFFLLFHWANSRFADVRKTTRRDESRVQEPLHHIQCARKRLKDKVACRCGLDIWTSKVKVLNHFSEAEWLQSLKKFYSIPQFRHRAQLTRIRNELLAYSYLLATPKPVPTVVGKYCSTKKTHLFHNYKWQSSSLVSFGLSSL